VRTTRGAPLRNHCCTGLVNRGWDRGCIPNPARGKSPCTARAVQQGVQQANA
jgi:hypothetical protein